MIAYAERQPIKQGQSKSFVFPKKKLVNWGSGSHALIVSHNIRLRKVYEIVSFLHELNPCRKETEFCETEIRGDYQKLAELKHNGPDGKTIRFNDCKTAL